MQKMLKFISRLINNIIRDTIILLNFINIIVIK